MSVFSKIEEIKDVDSATKLLHSYVEANSANSLEAINRALCITKDAHKNQFRKSGEPYVVHPILVATLVASYGGDESMVVSALLHDVVEDTAVDIEEIFSMFGDDVATLVDGMTKIVELRVEELAPSGSDEKLITSALTFRKMLLTSVKDPRVLVVKLCDRVHNMLTLDALPPHKQKRIAEESLVVYAPIAHRLGISSLKNELENLSFFYIFPDDFKKIDEYLQKNYEDMHLKLNTFATKVETLLIDSGFKEDDFDISFRIKRPYSIYLKMQRKGVSLEEVLDLLAIRILVKSDIECYKVLGIIHLNFKPIVSRFKDYIAVPKENGYETIHTTVFDDSAIFEMQIRTFNMHNSAEYGVAAHWKYKDGGRAPSLDWISDIDYKSTNIKEFYELAKNDLYSEDISVFSPKGDVYTLPMGAVALDFAYAVHSEVGDLALMAYINKQKGSLLSVLKNGDIVKIETGDTKKLRCSWVDAVKTSRAKNHIKINCAQRLKDLDRLIGVNILHTILQKDVDELEYLLKDMGLENTLYKLPRDLNYLREVKNRLKSFYRKNANIFRKIQIRILKLKPIEFDNIVIYSNYNISSVSFDYCCHPKRGDSIIGFKVGNRVFIHHKLCEHAHKMVEERSDMVYVEWKKDNLLKYSIIVSLENKKGELADFLKYVASFNIDILSIRLGDKESHTNHCHMCVETDIEEKRQLNDILSRKYKVIDIVSNKDPYGEK